MCPALEHLTSIVDFERLAACIHHLYGPLVSAESLQRHLFSNSRAVAIPLYALLQWIKSIRNAPASWWSALFGKAMKSYAREPHTHYLLFSHAIRSFDPIAALAALLPFKPDLSFVPKSAVWCSQQEDVLRMHNGPEHRLKAAHQAYASHGSLSHSIYQVLESKGIDDFLGVLAILRKHGLAIRKTEPSIVTGIARKAIESGQTRLWMDAMQVFKFRVTHQIREELLEIAGVESDGAVAKSIRQQVTKDGLLRSKTIIR